MFVIAVGRADDFGSCEAAAVLWAFVAVLGCWIAVWIWVCGVLGWIVISLVGAVGAIDSIEEVIERGAFHCVADLVEGSLLRVDQGHRIFEVQIGLAVVDESSECLL